MDHLGPPDAPQAGSHAAADDRVAVQEDALVCGHTRAPVAMSSSEESASCRRSPRCPDGHARGQPCDHPWGQPRPFPIGPAVSSSRVVRDPCSPVRRGLEGATHATGIACKGGALPTERPTRGDQVEREDSLRLDAAPPSGEWRQFGSLLDGGKPGWRWHRCGSHTRQSGARAFAPPWSSQRRAQRRSSALRPWPDALRRNVTQCHARVARGREQGRDASSGRRRLPRDRHSARVTQP